MATLPTDLRAGNRSRLLAALRDGGAASRSELAGRTGLSRPTAGAIVEALLREGVVSEETASTGPADRPGRPGRTVRRRDDLPLFLVAEIDGATARSAILPAAPPAADEAVVWQHQDALPDSVAGVADLLRARCAGSGVRAVAVSLSGVVDEGAGTVLFSHRLRWAQGIDLGRQLGAACGVPVHLVQEIRALALGHLAAHPGERDFLLVDSGTGLGAAAVLGGEVLRGTGSLAGEIGHSPVPGNGRRCGCGGIGCLETLVAATRLGEADEAALAAAGAILAGACNALGLEQVVLTGALATLPDRQAAVLTMSLRDGSLAGRLGRLQCRTAPRRRALGLHRQLSARCIDDQKGIS